MRLESGTYTSPIGPLTMVESGDGPLVVEYPARAARVRWSIRATGVAPTVEAADGACIRTREWLDAYFAGEPDAFSFPRYLSRWFDISAPQLAVLRAIRRIPFGETRSYHDVARVTGLNPRVVGQLVGSNHLCLLIPCHRVVGKDGSLVGYGGGVAKKRWLLGHELRHAGVVLR